MKSRYLWWVLLATVLVILACDRDKDSAPAAQNPAPASSDTKGTALNLPPYSGPPPTFDGDRALQYVKDIVKFGPRPLGSSNHKKVEEYIDSRLKGDQVDGISIVASHYDTNYPLKDTPYVGANDGGSSSALLLELANQLRGKTLEGYSVWLVWDDAEEAMKPEKEMPFMDDSLYGISHLAEKWQADGTLKKIKAFLLADMIGDADLNIDRDQNSTPWLENVVYEAATRMGYQSHFFGRDNQVSDDHLPFMKRGVPCADLIDFDYGYNNVFWHTPQDTVDKLSATSLKIVGSVVIETIRIVDSMPQVPPK